MKCSRSCSSGSTSRRCRCKPRCVPCACRAHMRGFPQSGAAQTSMTHAQCAQVLDLLQSICERSGEAATLLVQAGGISFLQVCVCVCVRARALLPVFTDTSIACMRCTCKHTGVCMCLCVSTSLRMYAKHWMRISNTCTACTVCETIRECARARARPCMCACMHGRTRAHVILSQCVHAPVCLLRENTHVRLLRVLVYATGHEIGRGDGAAAHYTDAPQSPVASGPTVHWRSGAGGRRRGVRCGGGI